MGHKQSLCFRGSFSSREKSPQVIVDTSDKHLDLSLAKQASWGGGREKKKECKNPKPGPPWPVRRTRERLILWAFSCFASC